MGCNCKNGSVNKVRVSKVTKSPIHSNGRVGSSNSGRILRREIK